MNDASTFDTFQMKMLLAVLSQFHVLIHCLSSRLRHIFHDGAVCGKLIQITVNRRDIFIISSFLRRLLRIRSSAGTSNMKSSEFIISTTLRQKSRKTPFSRTRGRVHMEHIRPTHASMRVRLCSMLTFAFANIISHFYASAKVCETISLSPKIQFHMLQS